jgi:hypothetical protein
MSDHDTITPESDDELRARLQAFAQEVKERTDTEAALERMPRRSRPSTIRLLAIAACLVLAVSIAAVVVADRQSVDTVPPAESPTTECPNPSQPRTIAPGGQMKNRFAAPVASAATALMLLGACSDDDGPTTLAKGEDVDFVGSGSLADQTMEITAEEDDGEVTGEVSFDPHGLVASLQCADTDTDGLVLIGGEVTTSGDDGDEPVGSWITVIIKEGDPDRVVVWFGGEATDSCRDVIEEVPQNHRGDDGDVLFEVEDGDDIETS